MTVSNNIPNSIVDIATSGKDGTYGIVKISDDGTLSITDDGVLSPTASFVQADPNATPPTLGLVKVDGVTIKIDANGVISGASPISIATTNSYGTVIPDGKTIKESTDGTIYSDGKPPIATDKTLGIIKPDGTGIKIEADGTLSTSVDTSDLPVFKAETITDKGVNGVVPKPTKDDVDSYLCADGTWGKIEVEVPETIKTKIHQIIEDERTATLSKDNELNKAIDAIPPGSGHEPTFALGNMTNFMATPYGVLAIKLYFTQPNLVSITTVADKEAIVLRAAGVMIRRSSTDYPKTITDGDLVIDVKSADFDKYNKDNAYIDNKNLVVGTTYYYTAFPYTSDEVYNESGVDANHASAFCLGSELYGFDIYQDDDNPDTRVHYASDCINATWSPINIDFDKGTYDLGEWKNAFFMKLIRPVMLNYDGTVAYELDHDDQTYKKELDSSGTKVASDISNQNFTGNAMVEFPKMYFARWTDSDGKISHIRISNTDLGNVTDSSGNILATYKCYAHITDV